MNFTESFSEFSSKLGPMDLALYAGVGIVLWVLFKDKLSPIQKIVLEFINKFLKTPSAGIVKTIENNTEVVKNKDLFFDLVVSWKQTRDLAVLSGCAKAVEVADQMFPYLSPEVCSDKETVDAK
jgi:hypothetical protein